jgi:hypothetical protein
MSDWHEVPDEDRSADRRTRSTRRRVRLLAREERMEERRAKVIPLFPRADAHPAGRSPKALRDRVAAFMAELEPIESDWF